jgi:uncharacterized protein YaiI (UPF0178 family)
MKIWVDADACPVALKNILIKAAISRHIQTVFIANKPIYFQASPYLSAIQVSQGADIADQYIVDHSTPGDLVITQDIPLAAQLIAKQVVVISLHGTLLTTNNIGERLSIRNFMQDLRDNGTQTSGPKPFSAKDIQKFAQTFDQQLRRMS